MTTGTNPRPPLRVVRKLPPRSGDRNDRLSLEGSHERRREDRAGWHRHADPSVSRRDGGFQRCVRRRGASPSVSGCDASASVGSISWSQSQYRRA